MSIHVVPDNMNTSPVEQANEKKEVEKNGHVYISCGKTKFDVMKLLELAIQVAMVVGLVGISVAIVSVSGQGSFSSKLDEMTTEMSGLKQTVAQMKAPALACCPNGWTRYEGSCYRFKNQKVSWHEAKILCSDIGGHLARIESKNENIFLEQALQERHFFDNKDNYGYWIDGNDIAVDGVWVWEDNVNVTFSDWGPGEPNSLNGQQEDCINLIGSLNFTWNDNKCDAKWEFICELADEEGPIIG